jgi:hypothetical protein
MEARRSLGLEEYEAVFRKNEIDESVLPDITESVLPDSSSRAQKIASTPSSLLSLV